MKNSILFSAVFSLALVCSTCTSEPIVIPHELNGVYEGIAFARLSGKPMSLLFPGWSYTEQIKLEIVYPSFTKTRLGEAEGCNGTVTLAGNELQFDGGDCGCWCDCALLDYCGGDIILGNVQYEWKGDSLILFKESEINGQQHVKRIALLRK